MVDGVWRVGWVVTRLQKSRLVECERRQDGQIAAREPPLALTPLITGLFRILHMRAVGYSCRDEVVTVETRPLSQTAKRPPDNAMVHCHDL